MLETSLEGFPVQVFCVMPEPQENCVTKTGQVILRFCRIKGEGVKKLKEGGRKYTSTLY